MHLHFDNETLKTDFNDLLDAFIVAGTGHEKHKGHAKRLRDPERIERLNAIFQIAVNCAQCGKSIICDVAAVYHRGNPISVNLVDDACPHCNGAKGHHYKSTKALKA
jgi:hypothetical protein